MEFLLDVFHSFPDWLSFQETVEYTKMGPQMPTVVSVTARMLKGQGSGVFSVWQSGRQLLAFVAPSLCPGQWL